MSNENIPRIDCKAAVIENKLQIEITMLSAADAVHLARILPKVFEGAIAEVMGNDAKETVVVNKGIDRLNN